METVYLSEERSNPPADLSPLHLLENLQTFPIENELDQEQAVLEFLVRVVKPDMVFMVEKRTDCFPHWYDFVLVLAGSPGQSFRELEPVLDFATACCASISCSLLNWGQLKELLYKGEFFYLTHCCYKNLVYNRTASKLPKVSFASLLATRQRASVTFEAGKKLSSLFYQGASMYAAGRENTMATFMLQQTIEQCYRWLTRAFYGRDQKTHSLRALKTHIRRIAPSLLDYFPDETEEDKEILDLLEHVYLDSRYTSDFIVSDKQLAVLMERTKGLLEEAAEVFEEKMRVLDIGE
ncbi:HEPN domain-containing protein [Desertivirga arenae]|uniref:HEPN domain-containing protein n=1 Tax=Desertivirga arenae TaxID=2810309 RepID=UPI001A9760D4|nr:HEPN domain-containing protein [Pedobacter sp. SYSU D00823]